MPQLLTARATRIAREHLDQYIDVPISAFAKPRQYNPDGGFRTFEICYGCMQTSEVYVLMVLRVHDDGTVKVFEDRRDVIRSLLREKSVELPGRSHALENVTHQFDRAMTRADIVFPDWYKGFRLVSEKTVDVLVAIRTKADTHVDVPIVLFRSRNDKAKFFKDFGGDPESRLSVILPPELPDAEMRQYLFAQLEQRR